MGEGGNKLQKGGGWVIRYFLTRHEGVQELGICAKLFLFIFFRKLNYAQRERERDRKREREREREMY